MGNTSNLNLAEKVANSVSHQVKMIPENTISQLFTKCFMDLANFIDFKTL